MYCFHVLLLFYIQVAGSAMVLFKLSPKLTGLMIVILPIIIVAGTLIGAVLRSISSKAQAQVHLDFFIFNLFVFKKPLVCIMYIFIDHLCKIYCKFCWKWLKILIAICGHRVFSETTAKFKEMLAPVDNAVSFYRLPGVITS